MAGIGDEIDPHPFGNPAVSAVAQGHQPRTAFDPPDAHRPAPIGLAEPRYLDGCRGIAVRCDQLGGDRVTQRQPEIALHLLRAEQPARRAIGMADPLTIDDHHDIVNGVDQFGGAIGDLRVHSRRRQQGGRHALGLARNPGEESGDQPGDQRCGGRRRQQPGDPRHRAKREQRADHAAITHLNILARRRQRYMLH